MVAFAISSLVFAILAIFVPFFGVLVSGLSGVLAWLSVGKGNALGAAAIIINFANIILLSPGYLVVAGLEASQRTPEQSKMFIIWAIVLCIQIIAIFLFMLNATYPYLKKLRTTKTKPRSRSPLKPQAPEVTCKQKTNLRNTNPEMREKTVTPLTRILVNNVHGKRKMDSKFWNSSFNDGELHDISIDNSAPHKSHLKFKKKYRNVVNTLLIIFGILTISLFLRPDLFSFLEYSNIYNTMTNVLPKQGKEVQEWKSTNVHEYKHAPANPQLTTSYASDKKRAVITKPQQVPKTFSSQDPKSKKPQDSNINEGKVYSWEDAEGKMHFSNVNFPLRNETLRVQTEINTYKKATPVRFVGNVVYIPVVMYNKGNAIRTSLMLDTGCSTTVLKPSFLKDLNADYLRKTTSVVADGRRVSGKLMQIDYIKVGPFTSKNFKVIGLNNTTDKDAGLLGMNFLKNHPFKLDLQKGLIIWQ